MCDIENKADKGQGLEQPEERAASEPGYLVLNQKQGEGCLLHLYGCEVRIVINKIGDGKVSLAIRAPKKVEIERTGKK